MATRYSPKIVTDGLILCLDAANPKSYSGSGTAWNDLSGNKNNGILINGPIFNSQNKGCLSFDGSNDSVNCGTTASLNLTENYSIQMWVYANSSSQYLFSRVDTSNAYGVYSNVNNGSIYIYGRSGSFGLVGSFATSAYVANTWNNFALCAYPYQPISGLHYIEFFVNGKSKLITYISTPPANETIPFCIGSNNGYANSINGYLADVKFYNRALSSSEILQNYNATKGRYGL